MALQPQAGMQSRFRTQTNEQSLRRIAIKPFELIHVTTYSRPGRADHLCRAVLTYFRKRKFKSEVLTELSEQQEESSLGLFTQIEKQVHEVRFVLDVAQKQIGDE